MTKLLMALGLLAAVVLVLVALGVVLVLIGAARARDPKPLTPAELHSLSASYDKLLRESEARAKRRDRLNRTPGGGVSAG